VTYWRLLAGERPGPVERREDQRIGMIDKRKTPSLPISGVTLTQRYKPLRMTPREMAWGIMLCAAFRIDLPEEVVNVTGHHA
jgi:hypothetical protein